MIFIKLSKPQLRIASAVFSNFVAVWIGALFLTQDLFALTVDIFYATICWKLAVQCEKQLEKL